MQALGESVSLPVLGGLHHRYCRIWFSERTGILPVRLRQPMEELTGKKVCELFDLDAGTSTGGILGCGLFKGMAAKDIGNLYAQRGGDIFAHSPWRSV